MNTFKIAVRSLLKSPSFVIVCVVTIGLGIGVNTAMYSVVDALLFRGLPYSQPEQLVRLDDVTPRGVSSWFSSQELEEIGRNIDAFSSVGGAMGGGDSIALPNRPAEQINVINATPDFFATLGVQPLLGRGFTAEELTNRSTDVAIISYQFWQKRFGGRQDVVGQAVRLSGKPMTIIGVMPASADVRMLWGRIDAWHPIIAAPDLLVREKRFFLGLARLKTGMTAREAEVQLKTLAERLAREYPQFNAGHSYRVTPLQSTLVDPNTRNLSWMLLGLACFVLLIACANLANLQLARAAANARELAVRSALGASRLRLMGQLLRESALLSLAGGLFGLVLAGAAMRLIASNNFLRENIGLQVQLNFGVLGAALLFCVLTTLLFGLLPAWVASRADICLALKTQSSTATAGRGHQKLRHALIVIEFALALTLMAGASVMIRGFDAFFSRNHGWETNGLLTSEYSAPEANRYNNHEKRRALHRKLEQRLHEIPGIENAVIASALPVWDSRLVLPIQIEGKTSDDPTQQPVAGYTLATNGIFSALKIPLLEGSLFPPNPPDDNPQLVVINAAMAKYFWPDGTAVGKRVASSDQGKLYWREIVGVVGNVEMAGNPSSSGIPFQIYRPLVQEPWMSGFLVLRGANPGALKHELERAVMDVDPDISLENISTVPELIAQGQWYYDLLRQSLALFALLGLSLAAVGLYAVVSHLVALRTVEFGIRLALGATPRQIFKAVVSVGVRLALLGFLVGMGGAVAIGRVLANLVPGLEATDVSGVIAASVVLLLVALIASWWPARRATRVNPLVALRTD